MQSYWNPTICIKKVGFHKAYIAFNAHFNFNVIQILSVNLIFFFLLPPPPFFLLINNKAKELREIGPCSGQVSDHSSMHVNKL